MHILILVSIIKALVQSKNCNEISPKVIKTYVVSDSTILSNQGTIFGPSVEVFDYRWGNISNAFWIWKTSDFSNTQISYGYFSQTFNVPGKVIDGIMEFYVDNYLDYLSVNNQVISLSSTGYYKTLTTINLGNFFITGLNFFNATVQNYKGTAPNPGGICFMITISSEVLV